MNEFARMRLTGLNGIRAMCLLEDFVTLRSARGEISLLKIMESKRSLVRINSLADAMARSFVTRGKDETNGKNGEKKIIARANALRLFSMYE